MSKYTLLAICLKIGGHFTTLNEIVVSGVSVQKSREQSPAEANFPVGSMELEAQQSLDKSQQLQGELSSSHSDIDSDSDSEGASPASVESEPSSPINSPRISADQNPLEVNSPELPEESLEQLLANLEQALDNLDNQEAQRSLAESQQLQGELSSSHSDIDSDSDSEGASPASVESEPSSPINSPRISVEHVDQHRAEGRTATEGTSGVTHKLSSSAQMLMEMGGSNPDKIRKLVLNNAVTNFFQDDENYKDYRENLRKAHDFYKEDKFDEGISALKEAERNLEACKVTIKVYDQQLQGLIQKTPDLKQSTLSSSFSDLNSNIDRMERGVEYYKGVYEKTKDEHQQTTPSSQGPQRSDATDFKSNDPGRGSSGPGSRT